MEYDHMIETLAPNGTNHPLHIGSLPRRSRRAEHLLDTHSSYLCSKVITEDSIAVAQQATRHLVKGKGLPQLLSRPLRGRVGGHIEMQNATPVMSQHQEHVKNLETNRGYREEVELLGVILQECAPGLRRRLAAAHHVYLLTLLSPMSMPSLSSSPWMRGAPQMGFSRHILQIRSRTSREMAGRPGWPRRTFPVQNKPKPARCQAMTVSGLTMASTERQSRQKRDRQIHNRRSPEVNLERFLADLCSTPIWWRRARFSSTRAARERKIEHRVARIVLREMSISARNYKRNITLVRSDISRFTRGTTSFLLQLTVEPFGFSIAVHQPLLATFHSLRVCDLPYAWVIVTTY
jgi:hypothetical protein